MASRKQEFSKDPLQYVHEEKKLKLDSQSESKSKMDLRSSHRTKLLTTAKNMTTDIPVNKRGGSNVIDDSVEAKPPAVTKSCIKPAVSVPGNVASPLDTKNQTFSLTGPQSPKKMDLRSSRRTRLSTTTNSATSHNKKATTSRVNRRGQSNAIENSVETKPPAISRSCIKPADAVDRRNSASLETKRPTFPVTGPQSPKKMDLRSSRRTRLSTKTKSATSYNQKAMSHNQKATSHNQKATTSRVNRRGQSNAIENSVETKPPAISTSCIKPADAVISRNSESLDTKSPTFPPTGPQVAQSEEDSVENADHSEELDGIKDEVLVAQSEGDSVENADHSEELDCVKDEVLVAQSEGDSVENADHSEELDCVKDEVLVAQLEGDSVENTDYSERLESVKEKVVVAQLEGDSVENTDYSERLESVKEKVVGVVATMKVIKKEFDSYALVLETIPESRVGTLKESLWKQLKNSEELFEKNCMKLKQDKPFLLNARKMAVMSEEQSVFVIQYINYLETLTEIQKEMKRKINTLTQVLQESPNILDETEKNERKIPAGAETVNNEQESYTREDRLVCNENKTKEVINYENGVCSTVATNQVWQCETLPVLDDLSQEEFSCYVPIPDFNEGGTSYMLPEGLNVNEFVDTLLNEAGSVLDSDEKCDQVDQDAGSNILAPQFAHVSCPEAPGFLFNIPLQHEQVVENLCGTVLNPKHVCSVCQNNFESKGSLYYHNLLNHVTRVCNLCLMICENVRVLTEHVSKLHTSYTLCPECFKAVKTTKFSIHFARHPKSSSNHAARHSESSSSHSTRDPESNKKVEEGLKMNLFSETLKCRACLKTFSSLGEVKKHEKHHKNAFHVCKLCGELFLTQLELQKHSSQQHLAVKRSICKVCYLDFHDKTSLSRHLKASHNMTINKSPQKFECICCYHEFGNKIRLIQHMRFNHQNDGLVDRASRGEDNGPVKNKCPHCSSYFKNSKVRAVHEIIFHETPPYRCTCNEAFFTKAALDEHSLKHTRLEEKIIKSEKRRSKKLI